MGIVAFAFGAPSSTLSNRRIAEIAAQKARLLGVTVYTQYDVEVDRGIAVAYTCEDVGHPPPTLRIARGAVSWALEFEFTDLFVVAAKPHLWRAHRDLKEAVREVSANIRIYIFAECLAYPYESWFCADSTQGYTSSRARWRRRERLLKLAPFSVYKRIAS